MAVDTALNQMLQNVTGIQTDATTLVVGMTGGLIIIMGLSLLKGGFSSMSNDDTKSNDYYKTKYRKNQVDKEFESDRKFNNHGGHP